MIDNTEAMLIYEAKKKKYWVAYLLLIFFGFVVWGHRFYAGSKNDKRIAIALIIILILAFTFRAMNMMPIAAVFIGIHHIAFLFDLFYTTVMVKRFNRQLLKSLNP